MAGAYPVKGQDIDEPRVLGLVYSGCVTDRESDTLFSVVLRSGLVHNKVI